MKKLSFSVLFYLIPGLLFFSAAQSFCQTLTGIVYDEKKNPLIGASVYLNGTTIGTITDNKGIYSLSLKNRINSSLVISFLGYQTQVIENPFDKPDRKIYLSPKLFEINEVTVGTYPFSREQKLKVFRECFLGKTKAGRSCKIENEDDIILNYDVKTKTLYALSDKPIIITNPFLSYSINFDLIEFHIKFSRRSIKSKDVIHSLFSGTFLFNDLGINNKWIPINRENSYLGSTKHLFKNMSNNIWSGGEFLLFRGKQRVNPDDYFKISDTLGLKMVTVIKNMSEHDTIPFYCNLDILYDHSEPSKIILRTRTFFIDEFGNNTSGSSIEFSGKITRKRVGDMVPWDFNLKKKYPGRILLKQFNTENQESLYQK